MHQQSEATHDSDSDIFDEIPEQSINNANNIPVDKAKVLSNATGETNGLNGSAHKNDEESSSENDYVDKRPDVAPLEDLTKSLTSKYYIQVVRISVNDRAETISEYGSYNDAESRNGSYIANAPSNKILYTIRSQKKFGRKDVFVVDRYHEDIEWLDHCLLTQNKALGLIIPPLPTKPIESFHLINANPNLSVPPGSQSTSHTSESNVNGLLNSGDTSSNNNGLGKITHPNANLNNGFNANNTNFIVTDQSLARSPYDNAILKHIHHSFNYDCFNLERYLLLLLQHPIFGSDVTLKRFLTEKNAPPHGKFKKGFLDRFTTAVSEMRKANQAEFDDFFQHERTWNVEYSALLRDALQAFSKKVESIYQLAQICGHFSTTLSMAHCKGPTLYLDFNQTLQNFGNLMENLKQKNEELQAYYQLTLGFELDFYCRYMESHKDTLNRRNCLLLEFENCNKALEKAKPNKREYARQIRQFAEKNLQECSETAKKEFSRFHADQSDQILASIQNYANANLQKSKDIRDAIAFTLNQLQSTL